MCVTMTLMGVFGCALATISIPLLLFAALLVPDISLSFHKAQMSYFDGTGLVLAGFISTGRHFTYCLGDYLGCVKDEIARELVETFTWETGIGILVVPAPSMAYHGDKVGTVYFSHDQYRKWSYDPAAGRPPDMMVASNKSSLPPGVLPELSPDILLNFDTGSAEHTARRKLLADGLPSLAYGATLPEIKAPPSVKASDGSKKVAVFDMVGYNLFRCLFGADVAEVLPQIFEYDATFTPAVLGGPILGFQGRRLAEIRAAVMRKVEPGEIAQKFISLAEDRGMPGKERLDEMVWIALFAGYGGTGNLAYETLRMIQKDPKLVKLFRSDPEAFMLEAARIRPPVGGMNPVQYRKSREINIPSIGKTWPVKEGQLAMILSSGANRDPQVFKNPHEFKPGRENAERLLSWNNEWGDFKSCPSVAGCPAAPRGCPGTFLSMTIAKETVAFFLNDMEKKQAASELWKWAWPDLSPKGEPNSTEDHRTLLSELEWNTRSQGVSRCLEAQSLHSWWLVGSPFANTFANAGRSQLMGTHRLELCKWTCFAFFKRASGSLFNYGSQDSSHYIEVG